MGGGIGMGNTFKLMAVSFQCMTKSTTKKKNNNKQRAVQRVVKGDPRRVAVVQMQNNPVQVGACQKGPGGYFQKAKTDRIPKVPSLL